MKQPKPDTAKSSAKNPSEDLKAFEEWIRDEDEYPEPGPNGEAHAEIYW